MKRARPLLLLIPLLLGACATPADDTSINREQNATVTTRTTVTTRINSGTSQQTTRQQISLNRISTTDLPREGQQLLRQIAQGGTFRYTKDGSTFGNREGHLPARPSGYYREYTVPTPGETDRGARRIVCGGQPPTRTDDCYYTPDHYRTFRSIR